LLARHGLLPDGGTALFQVGECSAFIPLAIQMALHRMESPWCEASIAAQLALGLPGAEAEWQRLEQALRGLA